MMKKKTIQFLKDSPLVISEEGVFLIDKLDYIKNIKNRKDVAERLGRVDIKRFIYKVGKDKVVGYLAIPKKGKNLPCIINLRGGTGEFGKIGDMTLVSDLSFYADAGYVVITTQYPGVDGGTGKDEFGGPNDLLSIKKLKDVLGSVKRANTSLIAMKGHSRGGLMTYMMLREVSWIKAAVIGAGPTDEFKMAKDRKGWRRHQIEVYGKSPEEQLKRSSIKWAKELPKKTPLLIMHGNADWRVPVDQSILMSLELCKHQIPHKLVIFEGADHGISEFRKEYRQQTLEWFKKYLIKDSELPNMKLHGE